MFIDDFKTTSTHAMNFFKEYDILNMQPILINDIDKMTYEEFLLFCQKLLPDKLYHYYPNTYTKCKNGDEINYSFNALKNKTIFMQSSFLFDDAFDSTYKITFSNYERAFLEKHLKCKNIFFKDEQTNEELGNLLIKNISDFANKFKSLDEFYPYDSSSTLLGLSLQLFIKEFIIELNKGTDYAQSLSTVISNNYRNSNKKMRSLFKSCCFTTTPFSSQMWGLYANKNQGFCIEYTIDKSNYKILNKLFPIIYSLTRKDVTRTTCEIVYDLDNNDKLKTLFINGPLRKNIEWFQQNEWRYLEVFHKNQDDFNVPFFNISKVFLGCNMPLVEKEKIINHCNINKIDYIGVIQDMENFKLKECNVKCENCSFFRK